MQRVQLRPGDSGEIMVFVMQTNVVGEDVEGPVVGVCFGGCQRRFISSVGVAIGSTIPLLFLLLNRLRATLLNHGEKVMLRDKMACAGVQRTSQERAQEQIEQRLQRATAETGKRIVKRDLRSNVNEMDMRERRTVDKRRPDGVENQLKRAEECLPQERIEEERLDGRGQVRVETCHAEGFVVC